MSEPAENLDLDPSNPAPPASNPPSDPPADPPADPPSFAWPDDWRNQSAKGYVDEDGNDISDKVLKDLNKFTDPAKIYKSYRSLQQKQSSGEIKKPLPENPSEDELAAYRKDNGIPESADKYEVDLSKTSDDQKPFVDDLLAYAHESNFPPSTVQSVLDFMVGSSTKAMDMLSERDAEQESQIEETLRDTYGKDYRINMNIVSSMLDGKPEGFKDSVFESRMADGTMLKNHPDFVQFMVETARELNPVGAIMPSGGSDPKGIDQELEELQGLYTTDPKKYESEKVQKRLSELYTAKEKIK